MNYLHSFHAGNFADVFKHSVWVMLLEAMQRKDKAFLVLDTHAGRGLYDLRSSSARQTGEADSGIAQLSATQLRVPPLPHMRKILDAVNSAKGVEGWRYYPGSPEWTLHCLRPQDRAIFCEKNPLEAKALQQHIGERPRVSVLNEDGYHALRAQLPAVEKRALVLIDPPYESDSDDFPRIVQQILAAHERMATAVIALWYPIKTERETARLYRALENSGMRDILISELSVFDNVGNIGLNGSGMAIIHPPYQLAEHLCTLLPQLWKTLSPKGLGEWKVKTLVGE